MSIHGRTIIDWNKLIHANGKGGRFREAFQSFAQMKHQGIQPSDYTFSSLLISCTVPHTLRALHAHILKTPSQSNMQVNNCLVDRYFKCHSVQEATQAFSSMVCKNEVTWTTMVSGFAQNRHPVKAFHCLSEMYTDSLKPTWITLTCLLPACGEAREIIKGREIHNEIVRQGFHNVTLMNALLDMYAKCGNMEAAYQIFSGMSNKNNVTCLCMISGYCRNGLVKEAMKVFDEMPITDLYSWTAIISGCTQNGLAIPAFYYFNDMKKHGCRPNSKTFAAIVSASASLCSLHHGMALHGELIKTGYDNDSFVGSSLVDMYSKCGNLNGSFHVFEELPLLCRRDPVLWTSMIAGYGNHGCFEEAVGVFGDMLERGVEPDDVTFLELLNACCHAGMVEEGRIYFRMMTLDYRMRPRMQHYLYMVHLLGRAGYLQEAQDFIKSMPIKPDSTLLLSFVCACRDHGNLELAKSISHDIIQQGLGFQPRKLNDKEIKVH